MTSRLYQSSHKYNGYEANIGEIIRPLNIFNYLGYYILEFERKEPPLGWIFNFIRDIPAGRQQLCEEHMTSYSYAMMAVIRHGITFLSTNNGWKNCGYTRWLTYSM